MPTHASSALIRLYLLLLGVPLSSIRVRAKLLLLLLKGGATHVHRQVL
jgi:hypothetical protein